MRWARDVAAECRTSIISVRSLLTATMLAMVVGMDAGPIVVHVLKTTLDVIAETAIETLTIVVGDAAIAVIFSPIDRRGILDTLRPHSHNGLPDILRMWRNWQTRRSQKPVMVTSWRFKSSHPHQKVPIHRLR